MGRKSRTVDPTIATRVFEQLDRRGIKGSTLAEALGTSEGSVSRWRQGHTGISRRHLDSIASFLGVSVEFLTGGEEGNRVRADQVLEAVRAGITQDTIRGLERFKPETISMAVVTALDRFGALGIQKKPRIEASKEKHRALSCNERMAVVEGGRVEE